MINLFDEEFYPTPIEVIERMMRDEDVAGKHVLEPSAGSGNIVDWLYSHGAENVIACEQDDKLRRILQGKCDLISDDFFKLTSSDVSHVDYIVMNPPFSNADKHILHAWEIAPAGSTIIALCNSETLIRTYSESRKILKETISLNGQRVDLGCAFSRAERRTNVDVSLVKLYKLGNGSSEFDGYFEGEDYAELQAGTEGLMKYDVVRDIVNRYVQAVRVFDKVDEAAKEINGLVSFNTCFNIRFKAEDMHDKGSIVTRDRFKKELQVASWKFLIKQFNMRRFVTSKVYEDINKFVETQQHVPFTMRNVYKMLNRIVAESGTRMQQSLEEAFDLICSYSAENSSAGEKWKTNSNYMVNRKFIVPWMCNYNDYTYINEYVRLKIGREHRVDDIHKALCYITGTPVSDNYNDSFEGFVHNNKLNWVEWYEWGFFRFKCFKKGTIHFEFKDEDVWYKFNQEVAKSRGWSLPKKSEKKKKG